MKVEIGQRAFDWTFLPRTTFSRNGTPTSEYSAHRRDNTDRGVVHDLKSGLWIS